MPPSPSSMTGEMPDTVQIKDNQLKVLKVDEAVNTTFVCEVKNRVGTGRYQVTVLVRGQSNTLARVSVTDVRTYVGRMVLGRKRTTKKKKKMCGLPLEAVVDDEAVMRSSKRYFSSSSIQQDCVGGVRTSQTVSPFPQMKSS